MRTKLRSVVTIGLLLGTLLFSSVVGGCSSDDNKTGTGGTSGGGGTTGTAGTTGTGGGTAGTGGDGGGAGTGGGAGAAAPPPSPEIQRLLLPQATAPTTVSANGRPWK